MDAAAAAPEIGAYYSDADGLWRVEDLQRNEADEVVGVLLENASSDAETNEPVARVWTENVSGLVLVRGAPRKADASG